MQICTSNIDMVILYLEYIQKRTVCVIVPEVVAVAVTVVVIIMILVIQVKTVVSTGA